MKKTILALAVPALLAAGAANASITLSDSDGVTVKLSGAAEVQFYKGYEADKDATIRLDDGDLEVNAEVVISEGLSAVANIAWKFEDSDLQNDELNVGFAGDFGTVTFGRNCALGDDIGNAMDHELGKQVGGPVCTYDKLAKWTYDADTFYAAANYGFDSDDAKNSDGTTLVEAMVGVRFEIVDGRAYYSAVEKLDGSDIDTIAVEADVAITDQFDIALSYTNQETSDSTSGATTDDVNGYLIALGYQASERAHFAVGYDLQDRDDKYGAEKYNVYLNTTYQVQSNVKAYAELGQQDIKNGDSETGYVLGMEVKF
ncbi:porin [Enterovibrio norvegicus]|uniref:Porin n=1 Tax=Enterovibrio norvegicus TaxID=188144 RepID=A0ABV4KY51_9GAMM|nr:porin [Enterovibrio norvegicus]OEF58763.1 hypothetical protein A1OU_11440 [Enterovibrio norvegicus]